VPTLKRIARARVFSSTGSPISLFGRKKGPLRKKGGTTVAGKELFPGGKGHLFLLSEKEANGATSEGRKGGREKKEKERQTAPSTEPYLDLLLGGERGKRSVTFQGRKVSTTIITEKGKKAGNPEGFCREPGLDSRRKTTLGRRDNHSTVREKEGKLHCLMLDFVSLAKGCRCAP